MVLFHLLHRDGHPDQGENQDDDEEDDGGEDSDEKLTAEDKKEKLIREAIEKEKERLRQQDKLGESEVVDSESGKDNEA